MKMISNRPLYLGGQIVPEGTVFETDDQHARELVKRGRAEKYEGAGKAEVKLEGSEQPEAPAATTTATVEKPSAKPKPAAKDK